MDEHLSRKERLSWATAPPLIVACITFTSMLSGCGYFYTPPGAEERETLEQYLSERQTSSASIRLSDYFGDEWTQAAIVCSPIDFDELGQLVPSDLTETDLVDTDALSRVILLVGDSFHREVPFGEDLLTADRWLVTLCPTDADFYARPFAERIAVVKQDQDSIRLTRDGEVWVVTAEDFDQLRLAGG